MNCEWCILIICENFTRFTVVDFFNSFVIIARIVSYSGMQRILQTWIDIGKIV